MNTPLANLLRPTSLEEVVGQQHLISKNGNEYSTILKADFSGEYLSFKFTFPDNKGEEK